MDWKRLVILALALIFIDSCCIPMLQKKFYKTQYSSNRPIRNKYKLAIDPYRLKSSDPLKSNEILQTTFSIDGQEDDDYTMFLRFFEDGHYLYSALDASGSPLKQYNNLEKGNVGYYKIEGDKLLLEYFTVGSHDCGKYESYSLDIIGDSIVGYQKIKVEGLTGTPDW